MNKIRQIIRESILNELAKVDQYVKDWVMSGGNKRSKKSIPAMFLLLNKLGYKREGRIYRALTLVVYDVRIYVVITQVSEYYDLFDFVNEFLKEHYPEVYNRINMYTRGEKEVVTYLDRNFRVKLVESDNLNIFDEENLIKDIRRIIWNKNKGELVSFTKELNSAEEYMRNLITSPLYK